ncbi:hypothetical protein QTP88_022749 [Uroleucon formosanum]
MHNIWTVFVKRESSHFLDILILYKKIEGNFKLDLVVTLSLTCDQYFYCLLQCAFSVKSKINIFFVRKVSSHVLFSIFQCVDIYFNLVKSLTNAKIEKARKTFPSSNNHPYDWVQLIRFAGKNKFLVVEMVQEMFFDFNKLLKKSYQMKKTNENKEKFDFRDVKWIRYIKNKKGIVFYKTSLDLNAKFLKLNLNRNNATLMEIKRAYHDCYFQNCFYLNVEDETFLLSPEQLLLLT